ncbi:helix-turn-helix domain-containing protein, partial [Myxococcota bacterium]|nr:helix-turn-helix domain-containing protein [Myxococcota bacterium]
MTKKKPADPQNALISVPEAAQAQGIGERFIYRAIREARIPAFQIGAWVRVRPRDVEAWIESCRIGPAGGAERCDQDTSRGQGPDA